MWSSFWQREQTALLPVLSENKAERKSSPSIISIALPLVVLVQLVSFSDVSFNETCNIQQIRKEHLEVV